MSFLGGLGQGLQRAFDGTNLAVVQALLAGDYQGAAALRAHQDELQRRNGVRNAQVIAAKNLGIGPDAIDATNAEDLSWLARHQIVARMLDRDAGGGGEIDDDGPLPRAGAAPQPPPDDPRPQFAPPPEMPRPGVSFASGSGNFLDQAGSGYGALQAGGFQAAAPPGGHGAQFAALGNFPRAQSHAQAASLPRGAFFFAPDGSLRSNI